MDISELLNIITHYDIAIYGAGYAARNFYTALKIRHMEKRVRCFVVTDEEKAQTMLEGIPVRKANDVVLNKNIYICIAVHEAIKSEIENTLSKLNVDKYVWVHPYIMEMALGSPLGYHKLMEVKRIVSSQPHDSYAFAIRYLAIENYYKENDIGFDIYLKAMRLQCEGKTAQKRLNNFIKLIRNWDQNGYRQEQDILIDENYRLVDGTHRVSLACYHRMKSIFCTIFPYSDNYNKVVHNSHFLRMDELKNNGFDLRELYVIEKTRKKIEE